LNEQDKSDTRTRVDWRLSRTYDLVHRLQPAALIGNNHHVMPFPGEDFQIVERDLPGQNSFGYNTTAVSELPLETCDTMNGSWGYNASDDRWKTTGELVHYLVRAAGHDANLLLNVGPTPEGTFQPEVFDRLAGLGAWTSRVGKSVYGTRGGPMPPQEWGVTTQKGDRVFVHVLGAEAPLELTLPGTAHLKPVAARTLVSGAPVTFHNDGDLRLSLDPEVIDPVDTVIELVSATD
jgi:alpha-L-fucosidase